jgi:sugar phosphate isomerase/epimerase
MRFAICNELFEGWPIDKAFGLTRQLGYDGIEIAPFTLEPEAQPFDVRRVTAPKREKFRRAAEEAGLEVVGLHWLLARTAGFHLTDSDESVRQATVGYLVELARMCRELGGSIMVLGSPQQRNLAPGVSPEEGMQRAAEVLRQVMPACEAQRVTLAVEPLGPAEGNFLLTAAEGIELVRQVDSPWCRLHLDTKAMSSEGKPIEDIIRESRRHLVHFHANDANRLGPGMGAIDFVPIVRALRDIDYQGWVSVEVFDFTPGPERIARESVEYLKKVNASA